MDANKKKFMSKISFHRQAETDRLQKIHSRPLAFIRGYYLS